MPEIIGGIIGVFIFGYLLLNSRARGKLYGWITMFFLLSLYSIFAGVYSAFTMVGVIILVILLVVGIYYMFKKPDTQ